MYDIALYGHLTFDTIIDGNTPFSYNIGGIVNVWKALKQINDELSIYICPTNIGTSSIMLNKQASERRANSFLNQIQVFHRTENAAISHIAYLNEIDYPLFVQNLRGCVSADICSGRSIDISLFPEVKILFVSDEDLHLIKNLSVYKGVLIRHAPKYSKLSTQNYKDFISYTHNEYLENINVLGAGDYFAACFLNNHFKGMPNKLNIPDTHQKTTQYLRERNDAKYPCSDGWAW